MLNQNIVQESLVKWMQEFVEVPHPQLGNWPPCPYARQARLTNNIDLRQGVDPYADCLSTLYDDWSKEVVIYWYDHTSISPYDFVDDVEKSNQILLPKGIVALEDHPLVEEITSGIKMNFGICALIVLQRLSKLNDAADQLREKGYYNTWSQDDLASIVNWRY